MPIWWIGRELSSLFDQGEQILFIAAPHPAAEVMVWRVEETGGGWSRHTPQRPPSTRHITPINV
jgi:hypothetical protein